MFGQNGLLYDSNAVGVLAASGLERNSFPSHSFSWHLSLCYASPTATTPQPPAHAFPPPKNFTLPRARELRSLQRTVRVNCHAAQFASVTVLAS
ncbi:hypothetical protein CgunFtcFv8_014760 [Champsocephalus gunnari]|uniref:Uncharacterized protein n=1 Tax=Champsocephalus gunnari TaxID=52237 RepID=A0AAN8E404_CHAGU|nr:hypothetical protein CgunFtcFv8_014760 [Champsocephalus gunnari]